MATAMRNPGIIWEEIETGKLAFSYNKEQLEEFKILRKVIVYMTEVTQLTLFNLPPKEQCRKVLKNRETLRMIGFID